MNLNYKNLHSPITKSETNAIYYLLRTLGRLKEIVTLQKNAVVTGEYGDYLLGENTITVSNVEPIATYDVTYTIYNYIDETSRTVEISVDTEEETEITIPLPTLSENEELNGKISVIITYQHIIQDTQYNAEITLQKTHISSGETNTITAIVTDSVGEPVYGLKVDFNIKGTTISKITDENGEANVTYTGTGAGWVTVIVRDKSIQFYDGYVTVAEFTGDSITLGKNTFQSWLGTVGDVVIDWGDGSTSTVNNPNRPLTHNYNDGLSSHEILFFGEVTNLGGNCFYYCTGLTSVTIPNSVVSLERDCFYKCTGLTSVTIPNSVTSLGQGCFYYCTGLTSVTIPNSVTSLGQGCFYECTGLTSVVILNSVTSLGDYCFSRCTGLTSVTIPSSVTNIGYNCFRYCSALIDYQLYWTGNGIITYNSSKMPNNSNTVFTIPQGETNNYTSKGYPTGKLVERGESLTLTCDKPIIEETETSTITATLKDTGTPLTSKTLNYVIKHGTTVISSGTKTTNNQGQATISYTGTEVGGVTVTVSYGSLLQETEIIDSQWYDPATITGHKTTWYNYQNILTVDYPAMYDATRVRKLEDDTNLRYYYYNDPAISETKISGYYSITTPSVIEFDVLSIVGTIYVGMYDGTNQVAPEITRKGHYRIVNDGTTSKLYHDDVELGSYTLTGSNFRFGFGFNAKNEGLVFKDFVVYAMGSEPVHTYSLSIASDESSILTTESVTISGTLLMDSSPYTGQSISLYDGATLVDTLTTDSNGEYSKTLTGLSAGTHTFKAVNTNAESSTVSVTVTEPTPVHNYSITITGDSIIQTGDNDNITATLKDNDVAVSGETLTYEIKHGSTIIDSGTDTTDSNGQITISYTGTGIGDVSVIVSYGSLLQETYELVDYYFYNTLTTDNQLFSTNTGSATITYSNDGVTITGTTSTETNIIFNEDLPLTDYEISYDITNVGYGGGYSLASCFEDLFLGYSQSDGIYARKVSSSTSYWTGNVFYTSPCRIKLIVTGEATKTIKVYKNDTQIKTDISSINRTRLMKFMSYANGRSLTIKNLKIKAL